LLDISTYSKLFLIDSRSVLIHRTHDDPTTTSVRTSGVWASLWYWHTYWHADHTHAGYIYMSFIHSLLLVGILFSYTVSELARFIELCLGSCAEHGVYFTVLLLL